MLPCSVVELRLCLPYVSCCNVSWFAAVARNTGFLQRRVSNGSRTLSEPPVINDYGSVSLV